MSINPVSPERAIAVPCTAEGDVVRKRVSNRTRAATAVWAYVIWVVVYRKSFRFLFADPAVQNWATVFLSLCLQALPFLVLGVTVSALIAALVPSDLFVRLAPRRPLLAVPAAGFAGALLPGCECSSIPIAGRLVNRGLAPAAALTFLLSAPAINPVVMVATSVAFPGRPEMVFARFGASLLTAMIVGSVRGRFADPAWLERRLADHVHERRWHTFVDTAVTDMLQAGGFLALGAALVATLQTVVPRNALDSVAGHGMTAVFVMAVLAVVLSVCSEADAFVAAGLSQFSMTSRLVFMVVGPMVDLKLIALQTGAFGRRFASRFAPLTFATAVGVASVVGIVVL